MGLFGFGKKKAETSADSNAKIMLSGGGKSVDTFKCIMTAGLRDVDIDISLSDDDSTPTISQGSFSTSGEYAITTYFDVKGTGSSLRPKKARTLSDQDRWMQVASDLLDKGQQTDKILACLNDTLGSHEFIVGQLSLADGHVAASIFCMKKLGKFPSGMTNIEAWLGRVENKISGTLRSKYMAHMS